MNRSFSLPERRQWPSKQAIGPRIAVGIATVGRADTLCKTLSLLLSQLRIPDAVFISAPTASDVRGVTNCLPASYVALGQRGLTRQRNVILEMARKKTDLLVFMDDDFLPCRAYLQETLAAFADHPDVVMTTGYVIQDGICGPGLDFDSALAELTRSDRQTCSEEIERRGEWIWLQHGHAFGCRFSAWRSIRRRSAALWLVRRRRLQQSPRKIRSDSDGPEG